jgi:hypothetical protein
MRGNIRAIERKYFLLAVSEGKRVARDECRETTEQLQIREREVVVLSCI